MYELREIRESKGLKREFVAKKLGVCPDHLNVIERGKSLLNLLQIKKLSQIYNIPFGELAEKALRTYEKVN